MWSHEVLVNDLCDLEPFSVHILSISYSEMSEIVTDHAVVN